MQNANDKNNRKAFTLAEVLITLTIIGVIAAITVPTLIQNTQKQEYVTALKKAYSVFSNATNQIIAEEGAPRCDEGGWVCGSNDGHTHAYEYYKKYLNVLKDCGTGTGCFNQYGTGEDAPMRLDNTKYAVNFNTDNWDRKLILSDGMQVMFWGISPACSNSSGGSTDFCAGITVDINGEKKPNQYGRDIFSFVIKNNGFYPRGCDNPSDTDTCSMTGLGAGCACKVLREGAMNY